jgi:hypothetical protein
VNRTRDAETGIEGTLLEHLLDCGFNPQDYIDMIDSIEEVERDLEDYKKYPEDYTYELQYGENDIEDWTEQLVQMRKGWWNHQTEIQMEAEADIIRQWLRENEARII